MLLRARDFEYTFPAPCRALVMGIVNVTPDSFSDGGRFFDPSYAVAHGLQLAAQGAAIIDVGGESTRPGAEPVDEKEELRRVIPVIEGLAAGLDRVAPVAQGFSSCLKAAISIDTMKPTVAQEALRAGARIVNDVAANRSDEAMWRVVAEASAGYVCMHMQGTPQTMQAHPSYRDVVDQVLEFFFDRIRRLNHCGVSGEQIILDPGIGFGKTPDHNLQLLANLRSFEKCGRPMLVGVSRKSFMGKALEERLPAALACASLAVESGALIIRTHDVAETLRAISMTEAILAKRKQQ